MSKIEELKKEADDLGVTYNPRIGEKKLQERIDAFYKSQETSGPALVKTVKEEEAKKSKASEESTVNGRSLNDFEKRRIAQEQAARKTRIISIVDNDQRINNHATTCTVSCSNEYFDLGTKLLPLNQKVEVAQGHINVLKTVNIPLHVKDNRTGLSKVTYRPRFTISYED